MSRLKEKNKIKKIIYSWPVLIFLLLILLLVVKGVWSVYQTQKISLENKLSSEKEYQELERRNQLLSSDLALLETDKGKEMEIREKFQVIKAGEQLAVIIDSSEEEESQIDLHEENFWTKILNFLRD